MDDRPKIERIDPFAFFSPEQQEKILNYDQPLNVRWMVRRVSKEELEQLYPSAKAEN